MSTKAFKSDKIAQIKEKVEKAQVAIVTEYKGMSVEEAIRRIEGIDCHGRGTSCPDQMAQALKQAR